MTRCLAQGGRGSKWFGGVVLKLSTELEGWRGVAEEVLDEE
jgi:hypothetical protein